MTPTKGNPYLQVRLEPRMHELLKDAVAGGEAGKAGGVSLFVRRLIYRELRESHPEDAMSDLLALAVKVDAWAQQQVADSKPDDGEELLGALSELAVTEAENEPPDLIRLNFARQLCGHMASMLYESSMLKVVDPPGRRKKA